MVILLLAHVAVTPAGKPVAVPMPVAPLVVWVMEGVRAVLIHTVGVEEAALTVLPGFTVIVNDVGLPVHPLAEGVTVTVPVMDVVPLLVAVKDGMLPVPLPPKPIDVLLLLHANVAPATDELKLIAPLDSPAQRIMLETVLTVGTGLEMTNILSHLWQEPELGSSLSIT
jgi:hypothetical protein